MQFCFNLFHSLTGFCVLNMYSWFSTKITEQLPHKSVGQTVKQQLIDNLSISSPTVCQQISDTGSWQGREIDD